MTVEPYDFRKPSPPAGAVEQRLTTWLGEFCALAPTRWARHLAFAAEVKFAGLATAWPDAALAQLPDNAVGHRIAIAGVEAPTLLVWPRPLELALTAGALGDAPAELPADRELTAVEEALTEYLIQHLLFTVLDATWRGSEPPQLTLQQKEPSPKYARLFAPGRSVTVCTFALRGPFGEQPWYWLLPHTAWLEPPAPEAPAAAGPVPAAGRSSMEPAVRGVPVPLAVVLGSVELPLAQVSRLRAGDVLILEQRVSEPLTARVAGAPKIRVWPGRVGTRQAVEIESVLG